MREKKLCSAKKFRLDEIVAAVPTFVACLFERLRERLSAGMGFVEPCLPFPAKKPPAGSNLIHEIKHDGYRLMARRNPAGVRLVHISRPGPA